MLQSWHARQACAVTHNPVHKTRESTAALFKRTKITPPTHQLHDRSATRLAALRKRLASAPTSEVASCSRPSKPTLDEGAWPQVDILTVPTTISAANDLLHSFKQRTQDTKDELSRHPSVCVLWKGLQVCCRPPHSPREKALGS